MLYHRILLYYDKVLCCSVLSISCHLVPCRGSGSPTHRCMITYLSMELHLIHHTSHTTRHKSHTTRHIPHITHHVTQSSNAYRAPDMSHTRITCSASYVAHRTPHVIDLTRTTSYRVLLHDVSTYHNRLIRTPYLPLPSPACLAARLYTQLDTATDTLGQRISWRGMYKRTGVEALRKRISIFCPADKDKCVYSVLPD